MGEEGRVVTKRAPNTLAKADGGNSRANLVCVRAFAEAGAEAEADSVQQPVGQLPLRLATGNAASRTGRKK